MNEAEFLASQTVPLIDDSTIDWSTVRRARYSFYQRFYYEYPGPIHDLKQRLIIIPAERFGIQHIRDHYLVFDPTPILKRESTDKFGNRVIELEVNQVDQGVSFEVGMLIESDTQFENHVSIAPDLAAYFLQQTPLTASDSSIYAVAAQLTAKSTTTYDLAQRISQWVFQVMHYQSGVTTVATTAGEVLTLRQGLCQDYAHLMLALCRAAQLPARYVSGHLLGKGGSHAWVEVFLVMEHGLEPVAFDPTNNRRPHPGYITVAVGRDYRDVAPTSGSFLAPYRGRLTIYKRAGVTLVEYSDGTTIQS